MLNPEIIIIDDGINEKRYELGPLRHNLEVDQTLSMRNRINYDPYLNSHGTTCAAIIRRYAPHAILSSIKILDDNTLKGKKEQLITALNWCLIHHCRFIHLSIGTTAFQDFHEILEIIARLYYNGCIIVAAYNNRNIYTIPASSPYVVGVRCNMRYVENQFGFGSIAGCNPFIYASGRHRLKDCSGVEVITNPSNSYAAPLVTAILYCASSNLKRDGFAGISAHLKAAEGYHETGCDPLGRAISFDWVGKAVYWGFDNAKLLKKYLLLPEWGELDIGHIDKVYEPIYLIVNTDQVSPDNVKNNINTKSIIRTENNIILCGENTLSYNFFNGVCWCEWRYIQSFFSESMDDSLKKLNINKSDFDEIDIPRVFVYGEIADVIFILQTLEKMFIFNGYRVKTAAKIPFAYLYGFAYVKNTQNFDKIGCILNKNFYCDLLLCGVALREGENPSDMQGDDLYLFIGCFQKEKGNQQQIYVEKANYESCKKIYQQIIDVFPNEIDDE